MSDGTVQLRVHQRDYIPPIILPQWFHRQSNDVVEAVHEVTGWRKTSSHGRYILPASIWESLYRQTAFGRKKPCYYLLICVMGSSKTTWTTVTSRRLGG